MLHIWIVQSEFIFLYRVSCFHAWQKQDFFSLCMFIERVWKPIEQVPIDSTYARESNRVRWFVCSTHRRWCIFLFLLHHLQFTVVARSCFKFFFISVYFLWMCFSVCNAWCLLHNTHLFMSCVFLMCVRSALPSWESFNPYCYNFFNKCFFVYSRVVQ